MGDCIVVGAGLAGAAAAASLARRGWSVRVLDAADEPARGASSLPAGLMAPHYSADDNLLSQLSRAGVAMTLQQARALLAEGRDWAPCGALEHRFGKAAGANASPAQVAAARLPEGTNAIWHPDAAWLRPAALVRAWLAQPGVSWQGGVRVERIGRAGRRWQVDGAGGPSFDADIVVVAAALGSGALTAGALPLNPVRGQVSGGLQRPGIGLPSFAINGHGHFIPNVPLAEGMGWFSGSTFIRDDVDTGLRDADHAANLERLRTLVPAIATSLESGFEERRVRGWAGVRCASSDRRPIVGELAPSLFVSTAMGSRGLTFCVLAAELVGAMVAGEPLPLAPSLAGALSPARFSTRAR